jgi:hypothetical protein
MQAMTKAEANERTAYYESRVEHYRAAGEDYGDSVRWAIDDTKAYFDYLEYQDQEAEAEAAAERAYERKLEDAGYEDAQAQDDYEAAHGVVDFITAWQLASPETAPR